jgi:hypothetical protein
MEFRVGNIDRGNIDFANVGIIHPNRIVSRAGVHNPPLRGSTCVSSSSAWLTPHTMQPMNWLRASFSLMILPTSNAAVLLPAERCNATSVGEDRTPGPNARQPRETRPNKRSQLWAYADALLCAVSTSMPFLLRKASCGVT